MQSEQLIGRYSVVRRLGKGGMGKVYLARDPELDRLIAIKLLHSEEASEPESRQLFRQEARALAALNHPGIVTVHEIGKDGERYFIAMEYLPGRTLKEESDTGTRSRGELLTICAQVAEALSAAHGAGVLHRDIKPENVMVTESGAVKVVDFGVALRLEEAAPVRPHPSPAARAHDLADVFSRTLPAGAELPEPLGGDQTERVTAATNTLFGTPGYMAPEILMGQRSGTASDVYSFGVLLFECLTGRLPYQAETLIDTLNLAMDAETRPPRLDERPHQQPEPLAELVDRMLAHDPDDRPSMNEVAAALVEQAAADGASRGSYAGSDARPPTAAAAATARAARPERRPGRRPWRMFLMAASLLAALSTAAILFVAPDSGTGSRPPAEPRAAPDLEPASIPVAIKPFRAQIVSYGDSNPGSSAIADLLGELLARVEPLRVVRVRQLRGQVGAEAGLDDPGWDRAAMANEAALVVQGSLVEQGDDLLVGRVELSDLTTGEVLLERSAERKVEEVDALVADLARAVAAELVPGATIEQTGPRRSLESLRNYERGTDALYRANWSEAALYLERAVREAPAFYDAWYYLALARGWAATPLERSLEAIDRAIELAPTKRQRRIAQGVALFSRRRYREARAVLGALQDELPHNPDVAYFLAEAEFHDGMHQEALEHFDHALELAPRFKLAAVHPLQIAIARRDEQAARYYKRILDQDQLGDIHISARRYQDAIATGETGAARAAHIILDRELPDELEPPESDLAGLFYRLARSACRGDQKAARRWFRRAWEQIEKRGGRYELRFELAELGEVLITADMEDATRELLGYWDAHPGPLSSETGQELAVFAAPLLGDPTLLEHERLPGRIEAAARAVRAEMQGRPTEAIEILERLVEDPAADFDYLARHALARNLQAVGRREQLRELCEETVQPAVFRWALLTVRRACRAWTEREGDPH